MSHESIEEWKRKESEREEKDGEKRKREKGVAKEGGNAGERKRTEKANALETGRSKAKLIDALTSRLTILAIQIEELQKASNWLSTQVSHFVVLKWTNANLE